MGSRGPYTTHRWQAVPISTPCAFAQGVTDLRSDNKDQRGAWELILLWPTTRLLRAVCFGVSLLATIALAVTTFYYATDSHHLLQNLYKVSTKVVPVANATSAMPVVCATDDATAAYPASPNFATPPQRVSPIALQQKWRPFYSNWQCGQTIPTYSNSLLANNKDSFADETNYTQHFIRYTDIVREYITAPRLESCTSEPPNYPVGLGGKVTCKPLMLWGKPCNDAPESNDRTSNTVSIGCNTGWHSRNIQRLTASYGHALCSRFCDNFHEARFFNVRTDGSEIACYCLAQCLSNDNPAVKKLNGYAGSNSWNVWALDAEGFVPKLLAMPTL